MEPKLIKEEAPDRDSNSSCKEIVTNIPRLRKGGLKETIKTPDSPEGARVSQFRTSPPAVGNVNLPSSAPLNGSIAAPATSVTSHNQPTSPKITPFQNGSVTPPLYGMNGSTSPSLSVNLTDAQQCMGRPVGKIKRFLSTLVQFGQDISVETGERVKSLVLNLVSNTLTVEEFHHSLQDVTNFPLRPFVLPFLRAYLPPLQRELGTQARVAKQTLAQYLRQHEHAVLDPAFSPSEPSEIFNHMEHPEKRRASESYYENGLNSVEDTAYLPPAAKRPHHSGLLFPLHPLALQTSNFLQSDYLQQGYSSSAYSTVNYNSNRENEERRVHGEDEWKNIYVMLNCILSMVEKTKRALGILQHRGAPENGHINSDWLPRREQHRPTNNPAACAEDVKRTASEIMAHTIRLTEDRVAEVKRKAEEAVNEVKRQAVAELQRAVAAAESKACELVASERARMEKLVAEARKQAEEAVTATQSNTERSDTPPDIPAPSQKNSCWNCGRKANETCSGCNMARYCGSFCQHKDWENHHQVCCGNNNAEKCTVPRQNNTSRSGTPVTASSTSSSSTSTAATIVPLNCVENRVQK